MAKSSSVVELGPQPAVSAPTKRRARPAPKAERALAAPAGGTRSVVKPLLVGVGVGAALAATVFLVSSQRQRQRRPLLLSAPEPTLGNVLFKAAMYRFARVAARRAVRVAASQAMYKLVGTWRS